MVRSFFRLISCTSFRVGSRWCCCRACVESVGRKSGGRSSSNGGCSSCDSAFQYFIVVLVTHFCYDLCYLIVVVLVIFLPWLKMSFRTNSDPVGIVMHV